MKEYIMSFFNAPVTNKIPICICSVAGLHTYISTNPQLEELTRKVRAGLGDKQVFRKNKQTLLPYVTPAGIFSYCKEQCMQVPSGLFVIDIDELASTEEAAMWRDRLFADEVLHPVLSFVSPGNQGVKLFIPYRIKPFPERGRILRQCPAHRMGVSGMEIRAESGQGQCRLVQSLFSVARRRSENQ